MALEMKNQQEDLSTKKLEQSQAKEYKPSTVNPEKENDKENTKLILDYLTNLTKLNFI